MLVIMTLTTIVLFIASVIAVCVRPIAVKISRFELERLSKQGDIAAKKLLRRKKLEPNITALLQLVAVVFLTIFILSSVALYGWLIGCLVAVVGVLFCGRISQLSVTHKTTQKLYALAEPHLFNGLEKYQFIRTFVGTSHKSTKARTEFQSRQEFLHELNQLKEGVLSKQEKRLINAGLEFDTNKIKSIMTPRNDIITIPKNELLGPLALDELHKTGYSRFPVIDGNIDAVMGIVSIDNLITLADKKSPRAKDVMSKPVHHVEQTLTLERTLAVFVESRQNVLMVTDDESKTVGLVTLDDVIRALFGRTLSSQNESSED